MDEYNPYVCADDFHWDPFRLRRKQLKKLCELMNAKSPASRLIRDKIISDAEVLITISYGRY